MTQKIVLLLTSLIGVLWSSLGYTQTVPLGTQASGLGRMAGQLAEGPVAGLEQLFYGMCYVAGMFMVYRGYQGIKAHRGNPHHAGIVNPVLLIVLGTILLFLPLVYRLADQFY